MRARGRLRPRARPGPRHLARDLLGGRPATRAADLRSYSDTYLREEIQAEALTRDLGGYARLLDLVAASSGTILNLRGLCVQAGLAYETARRYVEILEDTLVAFRIPAWSGSDRASLVAHPKLYLFDLGVRNALLRRPLDRPLDDERGLLVEHLVGAELLPPHRHAVARGAPVALSHQPRRGGRLRARGGRELWGIEVKRAATSRGGDWPASRRSPAHEPLGPAHRGLPRTASPARWGR